ARGPLPSAISLRVARVGQCPENISGPCATGVWTGGPLSRFVCVALCVDGTAAATAAAASHWLVAIGLSQ
ncbi:unnamed protein product, partial [Closterium sp. NIES-54]